MADTETELEEQLASVGNKLETPPSDAKELLVVLGEAESLLLKVEQSPSTSMFAALRPVMDALVAKEFLEHSNVDVKIAVASCISEITRITAPDAPYDDESMKDIFKLIVEAFKGLDDISSPSFPRRVSILETVAKVRSCVVMLDLECDGLILEMFCNFLATIRDSHSESVFSLMETIMTLVLEESEDISSELLSCLLFSVKNDNKDVLPITRTLGEKVIGNCSAKLKPNLLELIQSIGTSLTDYSRIVASICQDKSDLHENNNHNAFGECMEDDSKLSERTISEEMPQGPGGRELEAGCSEAVNTTTSKSTKAPMSNGTAHAVADDSMDSDKEAVEVPSRGKKRNKETSQGPTGEKPGQSDDEKRTNSIPLPITTNDARPRRGRPPGSKTSAKKGENSTADVSATPELKKNSVKKQAVDEAVLSKNIAIQKLVEDMSDSEKKSLRQLSKKGLAKKNQEGKTPANVHSKKEDGTRSDSEARSPRSAGRKKQKTSDSESLKKSQMHKERLRKGSNTSEKDAEGEQTLKEMASRPKSRIRSKKDESKSKESLKTSTKKRARDKEISKSPLDEEDLDEKLVGSSIQVWWPEDEMFYRGVVGSYMRKTKKHKILYADGETEVLLLKNERWEFVDEDKLSDEDGDAETPYPSEMPSKRKAKADPDSATKHAKVDTPLKRNTLAGKPKRDISEPSGKSGQKGVGSRRKLKERTGDSSREDSDEKSDSETPDVAGKAGKSSKIKDGATRPRNDSQNDRHKSGTKSKVGTPKMGNKSKESTPKSKGIAGKSSSKSKKQDSPSIEKVSEGSAKVGRKTKGTGTPKSGSTLDSNSSSAKGRSSSSKIEEIKDSDAKSKSSSGKTSHGSRKRRR